MDRSIHKEPSIAALFESPDSATRKVEQLIEHDIRDDRAGALLHQYPVITLYQGAYALRCKADAVFPVLESFYQPDLHHLPALRGSFILLA